jgi:hypothetical protein
VSRHADELTTYFAILVGLFSLQIWAGVAIGKIAAFPGIQDFNAIKDLMSFAVRSVVALVILAASILAIKTYVDNNAYIGTVSGILFTEHDKSKFAEKSKKMLHGWLQYVAAWALSLAMGVLSNVIYAKNWFW